MPELHDDYREQLAELCHEQWSGWLTYMFSKCQVNHDGSLTVPAGYVKALKRLMITAYADLDESQKDNDRAEADRILALR